MNSTLFAENIDTQVCYVLKHRVIIVKREQVFNIPDMQQAATGGSKVPEFNA